MGWTRLGVTSLFLFGTLLDDQLREVLAGPLDGRPACLSDHAVERAQSGDHPVCFHRTDSETLGMLLRVSRRGYLSGSTTMKPFSGISGVRYWLSMTVGKLRRKPISQDPVCRRPGKRGAWPIGSDKALHWHVAALFL